MIDYNPNKRLKVNSDMSKDKTYAVLKRKEFLWLDNPNKFSI